MNQFNMEDNSNKLSIVDQIKYLMDVYACIGNKEWLFLCQCRSRDYCESAGSEMGLKFIDEESILTDFREFINMKSGKGRSKESASQKRKQSIRPDKIDSLKRQILNKSAGVQKETRSTLGERRKRKTASKTLHTSSSEICQNVLDSRAGRVSIEVDHGVSNKAQIDEQILSHEIKIEIEPGEFEKVQIEEVVDHHSDDMAQDNFDGLETEEAFKSDSLEQNSDQEQVLVKTEQIDESPTEINQSGSETCEDKSVTELDHSWSVDQSASETQVDQSGTEIDQSVTKTGQSYKSASDLSCKISEIILNVLSKNQNKHQGSVSDNFSSKTDKCTETKTREINKWTKLKTSETDKGTETKTSKTDKCNKTKTIKTDKCTETKTNKTDKCTETKSRETERCTETKNRGTDKCTGTKTSETDKCTETKNRETDKCTKTKTSKTDKFMETKNRETDKFTETIADDSAIEMPSKIEHFNGRKLERIDALDVKLKTKEDLTCTICSKTFKSSIALRGHQNAHSKDKVDSIEKFQDESRKYECSKCSAKFWTELQLQQHASRLRSCQNSEVLLREKLPQEIVTYKDKSTGAEIKTTLSDLLKTVRFGKLSNKLNCIVCQRTCKNYTNLELHIIMRHSNIQPHVCQFCQKTFKVEHNMNLHKHSMHKDLLNCVTCELCGAKYLTKEKLEGHKVMSCPKRKQSFDCEICDYSTTFRTKFEEHLRSHTTTKSAKFMCQICNKVLSSSSALNYHVQAVHSTVTPFKCTICDAVFKTRTQTKLHQKKEHEKPKYHCDICKKSFSYVSYFKIHMQSHNNKRDFVCEVCGRRFLKKSALGSHQKTHSVDSKSYKCSMCDARFSRRPNLRRHEAVHKPSLFICDICGHTFKLLDKLQRHTKQHSDTYTKEHYTCKICDINCGTVTRYKTHIVRFHPETVPTMESTSSLRFHKCTLCPKQFNYGWTLKKHLEIHEQKSVSCPKCYRLFSTDIELQMHMKKRHRPKKPAPIPESVKSALKSKMNSTKSQKKTKLKRKSIPKKVKNQDQIQNKPPRKPKLQNNQSQLQQNTPLQLQPKMDQNVKEYTAVKASSLVDGQSLSTYLGSDINGQVQPLVNTLMASAFIRRNDVGTSGTSYTKMMTPTFFPNL